MATPDITRRTLIGAMAVAPVAIGTIALPAMAATTDFHAAVSNWRGIRSHWDGIGALHVRAEAAHWASETPATKAEYDHLDALNVEWMNRDDDALRRVMATPAPNIEAVIEKMQIGAKNDLPETLECALADLRRLAAH